MDSLLLSVLVLFRPGAASPSGDLEILISFNDSLPDPQALPSGRPNRNPCSSFAGVYCKGSRVTAVALDRLPLSTDHSSVALEYLESHSLAFANLIGTLAAASGSRCGGRLTVLDLAENRLVGSVADVSALATSCALLGSLKIVEVQGGGGGEAAGAEER